jgi:transposase
LCSIKQENQKMLYLGIDQHHKQITVSIREGAGAVILRRQVSTRPEKVRAFLEGVRRQSGDEGFMAVVEVCGFNDWLLELLPEFGCREVVLIHPDKRSKRKTDRRDASKLSELLWLNAQRLRSGQKPQGLRRVVPASADDQQDRQLTSVRKRLAQQQTRTLNKIQNILRRRNLTWQQPTKTFQTQKVRQWLKSLDLSAIDRIEMDHLLAQWELWRKQIEEIEQHIQKRFERSPTAQRLASTPGASAYGSLAIASRIGSVERFASPRSLANYFGLTPGCRNSGEVTDRLGSITKEGSRIVRFIVGQMVLHVLRKDHLMRQWYTRIRRRRGSKIARVAVMRRLVTIFWHMLKHQEPYQPGSPPRRKLAQQRERILSP